MLVVAAKNAAVDAITALIGKVSLHTGDPGLTGTNEVTGGSPAYAKQAITWAVAAVGIASSTNQIVFDVPACTAYYMGFWDSAGTTFRGWTPIGSDLPMPFTAALSSDVLTIPGHGISDGDQVIVIDNGPAALPAPLAEATVYFARDVIAATSLKLSATSGGSAIDLTTDGAGFIQLVSGAVIPSQSTYSVTAGGVRINAGVIT